MDCDNLKVTTPHSDNVDNGWAWVVVAASLISNVVVDGIVYSSGQALVNVWSQVFSVGVAEGAVPIAFFIGIYFCGGPIAGRIGEKLGCKTMAKIGCALSVFGFLCSAMAQGIFGLCITYGLFTGFGFCMLYLSSITVLGEYFQVKRTVATGIAMSGSGLGTFIFAPFLHYLIAEYEWRSSMAILATISLLTFLSALMYEPITIDDVKRYPKDISDGFKKTAQAVRRISRRMSGDTKGAQTTEQSVETGVTTDSQCKKKKDNIFDFKLLKSPAFALLCFSTYLTMMGLFVPYIFLVELCEAAGHSTSSSVVLISLLGIFNVLARTLSAYYADKPGRDPILISNISLMVAGFVTILVPHFQDYWLFVIFTIVFSLGTGTFAALRSVICMEICGQRLLKRSWAILMLFMGIGVIIGAPLAGAFTDVTGTSNCCFYVAGLLILFSGIIAWPLKKLKQWEVKRAIRNYIDTEKQNSCDMDEMAISLTCPKKEKENALSKALSKQGGIDEQLKKIRAQDEQRALQLLKKHAHKTPPPTQSPKLKNVYNRLSASPRKVVRSPHGEQADILRAQIRSQLKSGKGSPDVRTAEILDKSDSSKSPKSKYMISESRTKTTNGKKTVVQNELYADPESSKKSKRVWRMLSKSPKSPVVRRQKGAPDESEYMPKKVKPHDVPISPSESKKGYRFWKGRSKSPKSPAATTKEYTVRSEKSENSLSWKSSGLKSTEGRMSGAQSPTIDKRVDKRVNSTDMTSPTSGMFSRWFKGRSSMKKEGDNSKSPAPKKTDSPTNDTKTPTDSSSSKKGGSRGSRSSHRSFLRKPKKGTSNHQISNDSKRTIGNLLNTLLSGPAKMESLIGIKETGAKIDSKKSKASAQKNSGKSQRSQKSFAGKRI